VTALLAGATFRFDLDGTKIAGHFIGVDPPYRMLPRCVRQGIDMVTSDPTYIEITLTPAESGTNVKVEFLGLSTEDATSYPRLWECHLDRIAAALAGAKSAHGMSQKPLPQR